MPSVDQAFEVLSKLSADEVEREIGAAEERLRVLRSMHRRALARERDDKRRADKPPTAEESAVSQPPQAEALAARS